MKTITYNVNCGLPLILGHKGEHNNKIIKFTGFERTFENSSLYFYMEYQGKTIGKIILADNSFVLISEFTSISKRKGLKGQIKEHVINEDDIEEVLDCCDMFAVEVRGSIDGEEAQEITDDKVSLWGAKIEMLYNQVFNDYINGAFTPRVDVTKQGKTTTISITDHEGLHQAQIEDGYTPQRGIDYWTNADQESVKAEYDVIVQADIDKYNANAETKTGQFNANAVTKQNTFDTNAEIKTEAFNTNAQTAEATISEKVTIATTKASEASASAAKAKTSETNAKTSETNAKTSETKAEQYMHTAQTVADSIPEDYSQMTEDVSTIKKDLQDKVGKAEGKGLSTNDYTNAEKQKLSTLENYDDSAIREKIQEIELAKFPNVTIFGQPTINQGQISNFNSNNYCPRHSAFNCIPPLEEVVVNFQNQSFTLDFEITTGSEVNNQHNVFDSVFGLAFAVRQSRFVVAISTNGTSWNIGEGIGTHVIQANSTYRIKMDWNKTNFTVAYSTDGGTTYITDITKTLTEQPYPKQMYIGITSDKSTFFNGIINLNYSSLTIANKVVWQGVDDVGLATRADVSLSNLDEEGEARFTNLKKDIGELKEDVITHLYIDEDGYICLKEVE